MGEVIRGTSPALTLLVRGTDMRDAAVVYVSLRQEDLVITKTGADLTIEPGEEEDTAVITVFYTQEDMLSLIAGRGWLQIRWKDTVDLKHATKSKPIIIHDIQMEGPI